LAALQLNCGGAMATASGATTSRRAQPTFDDTITGPPRQGPRHLPVHHQHQARRAAPRRGHPVLVEVPAGAPVPEQRVPCPQP
jgi:hypothetical protein